VVLLDMNGTFMFGHDRLGPEQDFYSTYLSIGGRRLERPAVHTILRETLDALMVVYEDPLLVDDFPSLGEALARYGHAPKEEIGLLEEVFAGHELGACPPDHVRFLEELSRTHRLGVVSNICAPPAACAKRLRESGLGDVFSRLVFSSDARSIKPSPLIFQRALAAFPREARVLFVGDSLERDIRPAHALGLGTVWIAPRGAHAAEADAVISALPELGLV
jgi:putative hydrolase of the HAD superfamily